MIGASNDRGAGGLARWIILFPIFSLCAQGPIAWLRRMPGWPHEDLFPDALFADTIESALAMRTVSHSLLTDPRVQHWPPLFQYWLYHNYYLSGHMTIYHVLPLVLIQLIVMANIIVLFSPWAALAFPLLLYYSGAVALQKLSDHVHAHNGGLALALFIVSYPAVFMLHQANFSSGYANIGVGVYLLTALSGKWRWLGVLAMAFAINARPNVVLVTMIEFALADGAWAAFRRGVVIGAVSVMIGLGSLALGHMIDPKISVDAFVHGYGLYEAYFVFGDWGMYWNQSLFGVAKDIASLSGRSPAYDATTANVLTGLSIVGLLGVAGLIWTRRATPLEATFMAVSASVLTTPVYCEYHMLIVIAPLLVAYDGLRKEDVVLRLERFWPVLAVLLLACLALAEFPSGAGAVALFLVALAIPVVVAGRLGFWAGGAEPARGVIVVVSVLCLCALGGQRTNGVAVSGLLASTVGLIGVTCWRRQPGVAALARLAATR